MEQNSEKGLGITFLKEKQKTADLNNDLGAVLGHRNIVANYMKFSMAKPTADTLHAETNPNTQ